MDMSTSRRINITIHPIEIKKLDELCKEFDETRSGMLSRLIRLYYTDKEKKKFL